MLRNSLIPGKRTGGEMEPNKIKIMIADDNVKICDLVESLISYQDDMVFVGKAHNGRDAIKMIHDKSPDIVLLDLIMPIMDGMGVLDNLFSEKSASPKIIILSSIGNEKITQNALKRGADYYILKPFDFDTFPNRIKEVYKLGTKDQGISEKNVIDTLTSDIEAYVSKILIDIGISPHINGYMYIKDCVLLLYELNTSGISITKYLYPKLAEKYGSTPSRIERSIRHAIDVAWQKNHTFNNDTSHSNFFSIEKKPTNLQFISLIYEDVKIKFNA